jgi:CDP-glucose 4,6-dehydratase
MVASNVAFGDFYRRRRVLVTGCMGFKGSWLCRWLHELGADVRGYGRTSVSRNTRISHQNDHVAWWRAGDIRDAGAVLAAVQWARPELVFHLAADSNVLRSYRQPAETFDINVMGTVRLLEACSRVEGVHAVVVVTSDKCYADEGGEAHAESDPLGGADPYSASKAAAELLVSAWRSTRNSPRLATARAGNVMGGGDWSSDRIVVDLARAAQAGVAAVLRHPGSVRPWQHVLEPLAGYLRLGERLTTMGEPFDRAWNFGPDPRAARTVAELATEFSVRWAAHARRQACPPVADGAPGPPERASLTLDSSAAADRLGWRPVLSFAEAVDMTAAWYAAQATNPWFDAGALMAEQIAHYQARLDDPTLAAASN